MVQLLSSRLTPVVHAIELAHCSCPLLGQLSSPDLISGFELYNDGGDTDALVASRVAQTFAEGA